MYILPWGMYNTRSNRTARNTSLYHDPKNAWPMHFSVYASYVYKTSTMNHTITSFHHDTCTHPGACFSITNTHCR